MSSVTSVVYYTDFLSSNSLIEFLSKEVEMLKRITVYQSPQTADMLIQWELAEFDPYFIHEDF